MMKAFDVEFILQSYPEYLGENFTPDQLTKFKSETKSWLNTLPLYEYAHILTIFTAHHLGGNAIQYPKRLFNQMLSPVLAAYHRQLTWYRFQRALEMRKYWSTVNICPKEGHVTLKTKFGICTCKFKELLRHICDDYKYIKDRLDDDPKVKLYIKRITDTCEAFDMSLNLEFEQAKDKFDKDMLDFKQGVSDLEIDK